MDALEIARSIAPDFPSSAGRPFLAHLAVDDRFELQWLKEQLACAAS